MHYVPWCPRCDKPQREAKQVLNLLNCLDHIEAVTEDRGQPLTPNSTYLANGYKARVWDLLIQNDVIRHNDSYISFSRPGDNHWWFKNEQQKKDITLLCDTFDIKEEILFEVSW